MKVKSDFNGPLRTTGGYIDILGKHTYGVDDATPTGSKLSAVKEALNFQFYIGKEFTAVDPADVRIDEISGTYVIKEVRSPPLVCGPPLTPALDHQKIVSLEGALSHHIFWLPRFPKLKLAEENQLQLRDTTGHFYSSRAGGEKASTAVLQRPGQHSEAWHLRYKSSHSWYKAPTRPSASYPSPGYPIARPRDRDRREFARWDWNSYSIVTVRDMRCSNAPSLHLERVRLRGSTTNKQIAPFCDLCYKKRISDHAAQDRNRSQVGHANLRSIYSWH